jgi:hypothetical protein
VEGQPTQDDPERERLEQHLAWAREEVAEHERLTHRLETARRHLAAVAARCGHLRERVEREQLDVADIEGLSFARLLETFFGDLQARHDKELTEWLAARLKLEEGEAEARAVEAEVTALTGRLASSADPRERYHRLLAEKSRLLASAGVDPHDRCAHLAERQQVVRAALREFEEALWAGQVARGCLTGVLHALSKAQALGRLDLIGLSSNWVKYVHLDDAQRHASAANRALSRFQMELADVQARHDAHLTFEIGQLATFADYFFDDFVSDWVVQRRIDRSHHSASIARTRVNRTLRFLARRSHELEAELKVLGQQLRAAGGGA